MAGGQHNNARHLKSQFFTPRDAAIKLLQWADCHWDTEGREATKRSVLEPAAGSGAISQAVEWDHLSWITNELYPEQTNIEHDYTKDFLSDDFCPVEKFDWVVTNPPFSGKVTFRGVRMNLAMAFIHRSFEFVDKVAMILPAHYIRDYYKAQLPKDVKMVACTTPEFIEFDTAEGPKSVRCCCVLMVKKKGCHAVKLHPRTEEIPGFEILYSYEEATHAICMWGDAGRTRDVEWSLLNSKVKHWAYEIPVKVTDWRIEDYLMAGGIVKDIGEFSGLRSSACHEEEVWHYVAMWIKQWDSSQSGTRSVYKADLL